jgi:hypothetical protein
MFHILRVEGLALLHGPDIWGTQVIDMASELIGRSKNIA